MKAKKGGFVPFANEADVLRVGDLEIQNRLDRITLAGDVDLTADKQGLALARQLHQLLAEVVAKLEGQDVPDTLPAPDVKTVGNPFQ
jgi:hypothetical protein